MADIREIKNLIELDSIVPLFDAYRQFYRQPADLPGARKFLTERLENNESRIFAAYITNAPQAFVQLYPFFTSVGMRRNWVLNDLFVQEDFRSQGVGRALIQHVQTLCRAEDLAGLMLETEVSNAAGNHLYQSCGFERILNNFYYWKA
ncbi:MAG TPA: GNAT family N-acetyltransferase [Saprospiraceae bacterium]|nr:GNAT family N-acetyltransferase [Saprospiraceae bacterium]